MKSKLTLALLTLVIGLGTVNAQDEFQDDVFEYERGMNILSISPFHFFDQTFLLSYERMHYNDQSSMFSLGVTLEESDNRLKKGMSFEFQQRFFLFTNTNRNGRGDFHGVYVAPYFKFRDLYVERKGTVGFNGIPADDEEFDAYNLGLGSVIGYRVANFNRLYMDFFLGGGVQYADGKREFLNDPLEPGYTGITGNAGFTIGVSF